MGNRGSRSGGGRGRPSGKMILAIVITVVLLIFIIQNQEKGGIDFLFWTINTRVWVALAVTAILGFVAGYLVGKVRWGKG